jgi:hypothetical protein
MATATADVSRRRLPRTASADPAARQVGEDGYETRQVMVNGELVSLSLKPYPDGLDANGDYHPEADQRPLYWNPIYPGGEMRWRSPFLNDLGFQPTIQKERWLDGQFRPRNEYEEHMTREWMMKSLTGCNDPDKWKGVNHPEEGGEWRCQCSWHTGNWQAFHAHRRYLRHQESMSE